MITHLKGSIESVYENTAVLDVGGVGYKLICSSKTLSEIQNYKGIVKLFTVMSIREDSWILYGFISERERNWFNILVSVQGVGGKVAIAILSALNDDEIYNAFVMSDKNMPCHPPVLFSFPCLFALLSPFSTGAPTQIRQN